MIKSPSPIGNPSDDGPALPGYDHLRFSAQEFKARQSKPIVLEDDQGNTYIAYLLYYTTGKTNLIASQYLANLLAQHRFAHPNLIRFVKTDKATFVTFLATNATAKSYFADQQRHHEAALQTPWGHPDPRHTKQQEQHLTLLQNIPCALKAPGRDLSDFFPDLNEPPRSSLQRRRSSAGLKTAVAAAATVALAAGMNPNLDKKEKASVTDKPPCPSPPPSRRPSVELKTAVVAPPIDPAAFVPVRPHIKSIVRQITAAIFHSHCLNYNHNDLGDTNILFDPATQHITVIDPFASTPLTAQGTRIFESKDTGAQAPLEQIPPEILLVKRNESAELDGSCLDIFSFGVVFYRLLAGKRQVDIFGADEQLTDPSKLRPDLGTRLQRRYQELLEETARTSGIDPVETVIITAMSKDNMVFTQAEAKEKDKIYVDPVTKDLLIGSLQVNPQKRLKFYNLFSHPYFADWSERNDKILQGLLVALSVSKAFMARALVRSYINLDNLAEYYQAVIAYTKRYKDPQVITQFFDALSINNLITPDNHLALLAQLPNTEDFWSIKIDFVIKSKILLNAIANQNRDLMNALLKSVTPDNVDIFLNIATTLATPQLYAQFITFLKLNNIIPKEKWPLIEDGFRQLIHYKIRQAISEATHASFIEVVIAIFYFHCLGYSVNGKKHAGLFDAALIEDLMAMERQQGSQVNKRLIAICTIPPELLIARNSSLFRTFDTHSLDLFSLGVLLYQILANKWGVDIFGLEEKTSALQTAERFEKKLASHYQSQIDKQQSSFQARSGDPLPPIITSAMEKDNLCFTEDEEAKGKTFINQTIRTLLFNLLQLNPKLRGNFPMLLRDRYFATQCADNMRQGLQIALATDNEFMIAGLTRYISPDNLDSLVQATLADAREYKRPKMLAQLYDGLALNGKISTYNLDSLTAPLPTEKLTLQVKSRVLVHTVANHDKALIERLLPDYKTEQDLTILCTQAKALASSQLMCRLFIILINTKVITTANFHLIHQQFPHTSPFLEPLPAFLLKLITVERVTTHFPTILLLFTQLLVYIDNPRVLCLLLNHLLKGVIPPDNFYTITPSLDFLLNNRKKENEQSSFTKLLICLIKNKILTPDNFYLHLPKYSTTPTADLKESPAHKAGQLIVELLQKEIILPGHFLLLRTLVEELPQEQQMVIRNIKLDLVEKFPPTRKYAIPAIMYNTPQYKIDKLLQNEMLPYLIQFIEDSKLQTPRDNGIADSKATTGTPQDNEVKQAEILIDTISHYLTHNDVQVDLLVKAGLKPILHSASSSKFGHRIREFHREISDFLATSFSHSTSYCSDEDGFGLNPEESTYELAGQRLRLSTSSDDAEEESSRQSSSKDNRFSLPSFVASFSLALPLLRASSLIGAGAITRDHGDKKLVVHRTPSPLAQVGFITQRTTQGSRAQSKAKRNINYVSRGYTFDPGM